MSVQPISVRKTGELARLLEERGFGDDLFQKLFVENIRGVMEFCLQKSALKNGEQITFPITSDPIKISRFILKGYAFISNAISVQGIATNRFENNEALLIEIGLFGLSLAQRRIEAFGLRFGNVHELVALNATFPVLPGVEGDYSIFAPNSIYKQPILEYPREEGFESIATSIRIDGKLRLVDNVNIREMFLSPLPHFVLAFRK